MVRLNIIVDKIQALYIYIITIR